MSVEQRSRAFRRALTTAALLLATCLSPGIIATPTASGAVAGSVYYVSAKGSDGAAGTALAPWASFAHAQAIVQPGDTVFFRGGSYAYTTAINKCKNRTDKVSAISLDKSGASGKPINYLAYPGETPVLDFSRISNDCRVKGISVTADWIHLKGFQVTGVPQNNNLNHESWGIWISGSNNTFEQINTHHNMGPGLFLADGGDDLVLNSDSHDNYDRLTSNGAGESADGFGAHISADNPGNVFSGCRAWSNSDDGFDLINAYSAVTIKNSWAWRNGYVPGTTKSSGNGNGFKVGGYGNQYKSNAPKHTVVSSVAFDNRTAGFYANHHPVANDYFNNTSYGNHPDFNMLGINSRGAAVHLGNLRNDIAYAGTLLTNEAGSNDAFNSWSLHIAVSDAQFQSLSTSGWDATRQADGSLPALANLQLAATSGLIDKGTDVGLAYNGRAPDLGAFESR